jgi:hypothetical protein
MIGVRDGERPLPAIFRHPRVGDHVRVKHGVKSVVDSASGKDFQCEKQAE